MLGDATPVASGQKLRPPQRTGGETGPSTRYVSERFQAMAHTDTCCKKTFRQRKRRRIGLSGNRKTSACEILFSRWARYKHASSATWAKHVCSHKRCWSFTTTPSSRSPSFSLPAPPPLHPDDGQLVLPASSRARRCRNPFRSVQ